MNHQLIVEKFILSDGEKIAILESPAALQALMDYHDLQITQGEAMGFDCQMHHKRYAQLQALKIQRESLEKEWQS